MKLGFHRLDFPIRANKSYQNTGLQGGEKHTQLLPLEILGGKILAASESENPESHQAQGVVWSPEGLWKGGRETADTHVMAYI